MAVSTQWPSSRAVYGAELRAGALCLVDHGWPVVPGTCWRAGDRPGGTPGGAPADGRGGDGRDGPDRESVPAVPGGVDAATADAARVARWWSADSHTVLLATGRVLDALEVPAWMGRRMAATLRAMGLVAPLSATPTGRWWFPMTPGGAAPGPASLAAGVRHHGEGSWVVAPPSECADGLVHWRVSPSACGWRLPAADMVCGAAAEAAQWHDMEGERSMPQRSTPLATRARSS